MPSIPSDSAASREAGSTHDPSGHLPGDSAATTIPLRHNVAALTLLRPRYWLALQVPTQALSLVSIALVYYLITAWLVPLIGRPGGGVPRPSLATSIVIFGCGPALVIVALSRLSERLGERVAAAWLRWRCGWPRSRTDQLFHDSRIPAHWFKPAEADRAGRVDRSQARSARKLAGGRPRFVLLHGVLPGALLGPLLLVVPSLLTGRSLFSWADAMPLVAVAAGYGLLGGVLGLQAWRVLKTNQAWRAR